MENLLQLKTPEQEILSDARKILEIIQPTETAKTIKEGPKAFNSFFEERGSVEETLEFVKNCVAKVQIGKPEKIQNLELTLNSKAYSVSLEITWKDHDCNVVINFQFLKERFSTSLKGRKDNDVLRLSWFKSESSLTKTTINPIQTGEKRVIMEVYLDYLIADQKLMILINKLEAEILTKTQEADSQKTAELELSSQDPEPSEKVIFSASVLSNTEIRDIAILISYFQMLNYVEVSYPLEMNLILARL